MSAAWGGISSGVLRRRLWHLPLAKVGQHVCRGGRWTGLYQHTWALVMTRDRMYLQCTACGRQSEGFTVADRISRRRRMA